MLLLDGWKFGGHPDGLGSDCTMSCDCFGKSTDIPRNGCFVLGRGRSYGASRPTSTITFPRNEDNSELSGWVSRSDGKE